MRKRIHQFQLMFHCDLHKTQIKKFQKICSQMVFFHGEWINRIHKQKTTTRFFPSWPFWVFYSWPFQGLSHVTSIFGWSIQVTWKKLEQQFHASDVMSFPTKDTCCIPHNPPQTTQLQLLKNHRVSIFFPFNTAPLVSTEPEISVAEGCGLKSWRKKQLKLTNSMWPNYSISPT